MVETGVYENVYKDTTKPFNGVRHIMLLFKGSVFKLIWHDLIIFTLVYYTLSFMYRFVLFPYPKAREAFEIVCIYADRFSELIPISFLTGFYVTQVVWRWWDQFVTLPWPDRVAFRMISYCPGQDFFCKGLRRVVMRYINLSTLLVYRIISAPVRKKYPTYKSLVDAKFLLPHEARLLMQTDGISPQEATWYPIMWAIKLVQKARSEAKISIEAPVYASLIASIDCIEDCNRKLLNYSWVNFPLAYTQVAVISVLTYFTAALFGRQYLVPRNEQLDEDIFPHLNISYSSTPPFDKHTPDFYIPFFTYVELVSYMGWIKVAEALLNPFGNDDEDFDLNYLITRNLEVSYAIVDSPDVDLDTAHREPKPENGVGLANSHHLFSHRKTSLLYQSNLLLNPSLLPQEDFSLAGSATPEGSLRTLTAATPTVKRRSNAIHLHPCDLGSDGGEREADGSSELAEEYGESFADVAVICSLDEGGSGGYD